MLDDGGEEHKEAPQPETSKSKSNDMEINKLSEDGDHASGIEECGICYGVKRGNVSRSGTTQKPTNTNTKYTPTQNHKSHSNCVRGDSGVCTE